MSKSEEILARRARYNRVEKVADGLGRVIGVKRLKPSQQLAVEEMSGALQGTTTIANHETGGTMEIPRRMPLIFAACVASIDDVDYPFARNRGELNAMLDLLDDEGIAAVAQGFGRLAVEDAKDLPNSTGEVLEAAKN